MGAAHLLIMLLHHMTLLFRSARNCAGHKYAAVASKDQICPNEIKHTWIYIGKTKGDWQEAGKGLIVQCISSGKFKLYLQGTEF